MPSGFYQSKYLQQYDNILDHNDSKVLDIDAALAKFELKLAKTKRKAAVSRALEYSAFSIGVGLCIGDVIALSFREYTYAITFIVTAAGCAAVGFCNYSRYLNAFYSLKRQNREFKDLCSNAANILGIPKEIDPEHHAVSKGNSHKGMNILMEHS